MLLQRIVPSALLVIALTAPTPSAEAACASAHSGGHKGKVTVCHRPPGKPTKPQTLSIDQAALKAHLAHGDTLGSCTTGCAASGRPCQGAGDCCSGLCQAGVCATPCAADGGACATDAQCCSGVCNAGTCAPPCGAEQAACESGDDCCSGICTDTTKTCAEQCTIGPELYGPPCSRDLDCCEGQGSCLFGLCFADFACAMPGQACDIESDDPVLCCFDDECVDGVCVAR